MDGFRYCRAIRPWKDLEELFASVNHTLSVVEKIIDCEFTPPGGKLIDDYGNITDVRDCPD